MRDENKTKEQLISELTELRQRIVELARTEELSRANQELQEEIRKRQQVEKKLLVERSRLFSVLDGLPALVYLIAPDYSFRFFNRFFQERFGKPGNRPCYRVFHGLDKPCKTCPNFLDGKVIDCLETELTYPDGYTYQMNDYIFNDVDGSEMLLSFGLDITKHKQAETALKLSEEKFSKAFNASPMPMTISRLDDGQILDANEGFVNLIGSDSDEVSDKTALELGFWKDIEERNRIKNMITKKLPVRNMEVNFYNRLGEQWLGLYSAEALDVNDEQCIISVINDITKQRQMEIEMTRLDRLALVGEMAVNIAHEIRNPMTTIRGFLQIMKENEDYSSECDFFNIMIEEIDRANSIITEFLSLARNKLVELKQNNLNSIIKNVFPLLQVNANAFDETIVLDLEDMPNLLLDEKEIRQLLLNLVCNGLEAMPAGKTLTIRTFPAAGEVVLSIQDQGHGIAPDIIDKLGTPFFTTKEQGTGLGLAICYGIAARHNAKIDIESNAGGTTFYVRFQVGKTLPKEDSSNI
ncbi:MAG: ATP-binding protein [Syntrophomonas sp.]